MTSQPPSPPCSERSQARDPWRMRSHRFSRWEFVLRPYTQERGPRVRVPWNLARWPGHVRLVTPWRVVGVVWVLRAKQSDAPAQAGER